MKPIKLFCLTLPVFLLLDLVWLGLVAQSFYRRELGELARFRDGAFAPRWIPALAVYALIVAGLVAFVFPRLGNSATILAAAAWGAAFGFVLYGVYDLTNFALLDRWTWRITVVDICWGGSVCAATSIAMHYLAKWFLR